MTPLDASAAFSQRVEIRAVRAPAAGSDFSDTFDALRSSRSSQDRTATSGASRGSSGAGRVGSDGSSSPGRDASGDDTAVDDPGQFTSSATQAVAIQPSGYALRARLSAATLSPAGADAKTTIADDQTNAAAGEADALATKSDANQTGNAVAAVSAATTQPATVDGWLIDSLVALFGPGPTTSAATPTGTAAPAGQGAGADPLLSSKRGSTAADKQVTIDNGLVGALSASDPATTPATSGAAPQARILPTRAANGAASNPAPPGAADSQSESLTGAPMSSDAAAQSISAVDDAASKGADTVKVVAQSGLESPTPLPANPAQQVLAALRSLGLDDTSASTGMGTASAGAAQPAEAGETTLPSTALKSVTIQLQPAHLGAVALTVQRQEGVLAVTVTVGDTRALRTLEKDRDLLDSAVTAAGGTRDSLALTMVTASSDTASANAPQSGGSNTSSGAPGDMSQGGAARRDGRSEPATMQTGIEDEQRPNDAATQTRLDRGLYL